MSLHWLEEAGRLEITGMISNSLPVILQPEALRRISREENEEGQTARALLEQLGADGLAELLRGSTVGNKYAGRCFPPWKGLQPCKR